MIYVNILAMNSSRITEQIIEYTFYLLVFFVPIIFLPVTSELFEFNKMLLVYLGASLVFTAWLFKSVSDGFISLKRTPLDIPIVLFLLANIITTVFSIDTHTSIFGHYSRFHGGLLSTISYILLFYALVAFFDKEKLIRLLKILLLSGAIVAIYALLQHPTPLFRNPDGSFRGIDAGYWKQDAQSRAFSTLGHPNWLAAFIAMIIPLAFAFLVIVKRTWEKLLFTILLITYFLAFTFTYSRGGTVGLAITVFTLIAGFIIAFRKQIIKFILARNYLNLVKFLLPPKIGFFILVVLIGWAATVLFFGNAFTTRGVNLNAIFAENDTQLASAGSETGRIRLIIWRGAYDVFKSSPIIGSGLETFAYSYYQFRPAEHNLTSEWTFLYNKAHNEFVNYLATTGIVGFATYLFFIITFIYIVLVYLNQNTGNWKKIFIISASAGYTGYLAQNVFGFSVVAIALLFFLTPAFFFIFADQGSETKLPLNFLKSKLVLPAKILTVLIGTLLIIGVSLMWLGDFFYNRGISTSNLSQGYSNLKIAVNLRPDEPLYYANLGIATMYLATDLENKERENKIAESFKYLNQATAKSPKNISLWRIRLQAIYELATEDEKYIPQVINTAEIVGELAPTEAQIQYDLGSMYVFANDYKSAQNQLEKVVVLKFNYLDAWELLLQIDSALKDKESQNKHFKEFRKIFPEKAKDKEFLKGLELL